MKFRKYRYLIIFKLAKVLLKYLLLCFLCSTCGQLMWLSFYIPHQTRWSCIYKIFIYLLLSLFETKFVNSESWWEVFEIFAMKYYKCQFEFKSQFNSVYKIHIKHYIYTHILNFCIMLTLICKQRMFINCLNNEIMK